ncbi:MAG TPA: hypothetical protein VNW99_03350 [Cytophagaceae bacterium]|nr:hypothetical protein [Cytophagaceae bacterium]
MDFPGDLYFFLINLLSSWKVLYIIAAIVSLFTLALVYLPWIKTEKPPGRASIKIFSSPLLFLLLITIFIILMRMPTFLLDEQNIDESLWIAGTATFLHSPQLWTSFDTTTSGPLVMLPLVLIKLTGLDLNYASARLAGILFCIIPGVIFCYYTFRILLDEKLSRILILPLTACFAFMNSGDYTAYNGEHEIILFSSIAIFLHTKLLMGNKQSKYFLLYGLTLGALPFTKLQATPITLALGFCLLVFLIKSKTNLSSYALIFLSIMSPFVLILMWLLITDGTQDFWFAYIISNLKYGQPGIGINGSSWLYFKYFVYLLRTLPDSKFYFISLISVSALSGITVSFRKKIMGKHLFLLLSSIALLFSAYYAIVKTSFFYQHYFLIFLIPVLFFTAIIAWISRDTFSRSKLFNSALIILPLICFVMVAIDGITRINNPSSINHSSLKKSLVAQTINKYGKGNDGMAIWGWMPGLYVQTGLINGTRYGDCYHQFTKSRMQQYYLDKYLEDLKKNKPLIFADAITSYSYGPNAAEFKYQNFPNIRDYVEAHYRKAEVAEEIEIFIRKD